MNRTRTDWPILSVKYCSPASELCVCVSITVGKMSCLSGCFPNGACVKAQSGSKAKARAFQGHRVATGVPNGHGQNPNRTSSEHPTKLVVHLPQNGPIGFDPQPNRAKTSSGSRAHSLQHSLERISSVAGSSCFVVMSRARQHQKPAGFSRAPHLQSCSQGPNDWTPARTQSQTLH